MTNLEEYSKDIDRLMESEDFKKSDIDEQLIKMLEVASKYVQHKSKTKARKL